VIRPSAIPSTILNLIPEEEDVSTTLFFPIPYTRMLKKSASVFLWSVTREICEKGATWTDWFLVSFHPSRSSCSSRLSRVAAV